MGRGKRFDDAAEWSTENGRRTGRNQGGRSRHAVEVRRASGCGQPTDILMLALCTSRPGRLSTARPGARRRSPTLFRRGQPSATRPKPARIGEAARIDLLLSWEGVRNFSNRKLYRPPARFGRLLRPDAPTVSPFQPTVFLPSFYGWASVGC